MRTNQTISALAILSVTLLAGCGTPQPDDSMSNYPNNTYPVSNAPAYNAAYGVIDSIQIVQQEVDTRGVGAGAVVGGVVGGLVGNQIGKGGGRTAATAAGVVGGAVVGNQIQDNRNRGVRQAYQVNVRLDNGTLYGVVQDSVTDLRVGDRVRLENNRIFRY
jgi:outer membrane lipoprotein SlyB